MKYKYFVKLKCNKVGPYLWTCGADQCLNLLGENKEEDSLSTQHRPHSSDKHR